MLHAANEAQAGVAHEHAGQQPALDQDLEAVADAQHESTATGVGAHRLHHRRAAGDGAAAQVVAVGKAAGQQDEVGARRQAMRAVPHHTGVDAGGAQGSERVALAVGAGEEDDGGFHQAGSSSTR